MHMHKNGKYMYVYYGLANAYDIIYVCLKSATVWI